jgi:hypothetical protein
MDENKPDIAQEPKNPHVRHEPGDVNTIFLTKFGIAMSFLVVVFLFGLWGLFEYFIKRPIEEGPPPSEGVNVTAQKLPPQPRLQPSPSLDYRQMVAAEQQIANQYAPAGESGYVRIPVSRALELMAQKGFPVLPGAHVPPGATGDPLGFEAAGGSVARARPGGPQPAATQPLEKTP